MRVIPGEKLQTESQRILRLSRLSSRPVFMVFPAVNSREIRACFCEILPLNFGSEMYVPGQLHKGRAFLCPITSQRQMVEHQWDSCEFKI